MAAFEAWIVDCHLKQFEGDGEYKCQAAVWADCYDAFRNTLVYHLKEQGLGILWLEEVLPVGHYLARHGAQQQQIGGLARSVHPGNPVELGHMTAIGADGEPEKESYLNIEEIKGVEPLDLQFGVHPQKTVPDSLYEPLFGQPEPTEAETSQYGSAEAVPPMRTYAVLDAAKMPYLLTGFIESSELPAQSLFQGDTAEELKEHSPYLVELTEDNDFTKRLLTGPKGVNGLWEKELGIYIRSRGNFAAVRSHLRKFTRIRDDKGDWSYWRFWEPSNLRACFMLLLPVGKAIPKIADALLSVGTIILITNTKDNSRATIARRAFAAHETSSNAMDWILSGYRQIKLQNIYQDLADEGFYDEGQNEIFESDVKTLEAMNLADLYEVADLCRVLSMSRKQGISSIDWKNLLQKVSGGKADRANIALERFSNNPKKYEADHGRF